MNGDGCVAGCSTGFAGAPNENAELPFAGAFALSFVYGEVEDAGVVPKRDVIGAVAAAGAPVVGGNADFVVPKNEGVSVAAPFVGAIGFISDSATLVVDAGLPKKEGVADASSFLSTSGALLELKDDGAVDALSSTFFSSDTEAGGTRENIVCVLTLAIGLLKTAEVAKKFGIPEVDFSETVPLI